MSGKGSLKCAVRGFIGTFASRSTEYQGYWLFGFLLDMKAPLRVDLIGDPPKSIGSKPLATAAGLAQSKFMDQLAKASLSHNMLCEATLVMEKREGASQSTNGRDGYVAGHPFDIEVRARVIEGGEVVERTTIFVAHYKLFSRGAHPTKKKRKWWQLWGKA